MSSTTTFSSCPSLNLGASSSNASPVPSEENNDPLADIRILLQYVARAFYEVRHILLFDQLIRKEAMKDEELAARLGIGSKELSKTANQLVRDQLVSVYLRPELKPGAYKATQRTYYYIDYKHSVDVIKWRMWKMSKVLDDKQRNVIDGQGYVCPRCKKTYSTLDIAGLSMTPTSFLCEICNTPLNDNENDIEVQKNKDRMQRLNSQTMILKKNLQKAEKVVPPAFDIVKWVAVNVPLENTHDSSDGLAVATGGAKEAAVTVQLAQEGDMEAKRRLQEQQAQAKREANALPIWIAQSTVNGDLTKAGIRQGFSSQTNDTLSNSSQTREHSDFQAQADDIEYDAYFANFSNQTGLPTSGANSADYKRSPAESTSSLNSRSESRGSSIGVSMKRGRVDTEGVDEGYGSSLYGRPDPRSMKKPKMAMVKAVGLPVQEGDDQDEFGEVKMITLRGKSIRLSAVTPQMEHEMTPEEYTIYAHLSMES